MLLSLLTATGAHAAGDATVGQTKAATCAACHGAEGTSPNPIWPNLAGQHPGYIAKQLAEFKAGDRADPTMAPMAAPLSEQDAADLAAYFSSRPGSPGAAKAESVPMGEQIYRGGNAASGVAACIGCHGPAGDGNPAAKFPTLSGQKPAYVVKQLQAFRAGTRKNDLNGMMREVAARMTDKEMESVAEYVAGLH
jgi:cytochrome c553